MKEISPQGRDMATGQRVKLLDVARHARVSPATVSRAIAQPELVSPATLARVRASAAKLGYVPDGAARALASGRSMTVGAECLAIEKYPRLEPQVIVVL